MTAISATFSDLRTVKGRKMCQLVFEIPVEGAEAAIKLLGFPRPDNPQWVGIAPLAIAPDAGTTTERQKVEQDRRVQLAGILCGDAQFQTWFWDQEYCDGSSKEDVAEGLRRACGIKSRKELATNPDAKSRFDAIVTTFRQQTGQMAEARP